ncbi:hypothetical protein HanIR_Chr03g0101601 [Helianthus annuus]|nr:hypothetical protein HanIR_Chr03g0101601 [Helianthus annuus]
MLRQSVIPSTGSLMKTIESFIKKVHFVFLAWIHKPRCLSYVHLLFYFDVQKSRLDI